MACPSVVCFSQSIAAKMICATHVANALREDPSGIQTLLVANEG